MLALKVIEGGRDSNGTLFSGLEWEKLRGELREIEVEIRNYPEDRKKEREKGGTSHMGEEKRENLFDLLSYSPWLSCKEIAEELSITERIIGLTLKREWSLGVYCRRGITSRGGVKYLWAPEGTLPY